MKELTTRWQCSIAAVIRLRRRYKMEIEGVVGNAVAFSEKQVERVEAKRVQRTIKNQKMRARKMRGWISKAKAKAC